MQRWWINSASNMCFTYCKRKQ